MNIKRQARKTFFENVKKLEEKLKAGDVVHTPGGTAKVVNVEGDKVNVQVDGHRVQYDEKEVQAESFKEAKNYDLEQTTNAIYYLKYIYEQLDRKNTDEEKIKILKDKSRLIRNSCNQILGNL